MRIYAVFVYCRIPGYYSRYIDSQWASGEAARARRAELERIFTSFNVNLHEAGMVELSISDTHLANEPDPEIPMQDGTA